MGERVMNVWSKVSRPFSETNIGHARRCRERPNEGADRMTKNDSRHGI
jgi:hypothetical protein